MSDKYQLQVNDRVTLGEASFDRVVDFLNDEYGVLAPHFTAIDRTAPKQNIKLYIPDGHDGDQHEVLLTFTRVDIENNLHSLSEKGS